MGEVSAPITNFKISLKSCFRIGNMHMQRTMEAQKDNVKFKTQNTFATQLITSQAKLNVDFLKVRRTWGKSKLNAKRFSLVCRAM